MRAAERIMLAGGFHNFTWFHSNLTWHTDRYQRMFDEFLFNSTGQTFPDSAPPTRFSNECTLAMEPDSIFTLVPDASPRTTLDMYMQYKAPAAMPSRPVAR